jgi:rfaE bifunctional protein nucleotidyltransferase chain/domain
MNSQPPDPRSKILSLEEMDLWVAARRASGLRIGFTCGSFDLLHAGHVHYLSQARARCDALIVAVNSDASIRGYKSSLRPVNPEEHRRYVVAGLSAVDAVATLEDRRPLALLLRWKPDLYMKGGDYDVSSLRSGAAVRDYGGAVEVIRPAFPTSSSQIIERIDALYRHAAPEPAPPGESAGLVLFDRDGTLIRNVPFLHDPARLELAPGAGDALAALQTAGFRVAIVTNQQGIGLGYATEQEFIAVNQRLFRELAPFGVLVSRVYFCPHSMADRCGCRKPAPGMVLRALREFAVPPERCFVVGDSSADADAAMAAGCRAVIVGGAGPAGAWSAPDLADAAHRILEAVPH